jgi:hypothetical protein
LTLARVGKNVERSGNRKLAGSGAMFAIEPQAATLHASAATAAARAGHLPINRLPPINRLTESMRVSENPEVGNPGRVKSRMIQSRMRHRIST